MNRTNKTRKMTRKLWRRQELQLEGRLNSVRQADNDGLMTGWTEMEIDRWLDRWLERAIQRSTGTANTQQGNEGG